MFLILVHFSVIIKDTKCFRVRQVDSECRLQNMFLPFKFEIWYTLRI